MGATAGTVAVTGRTIEAMLAVWRLATLQTVAACCAAP